MYRPLRKIQFETPVGKSLTEVTQSLTVKQMIERSERGILDLNTVIRPNMVADSDKEDFATEDDFSVNDRAFGNDIETLEAELHEQLPRAKRKKSSTQAQPREAAEHSKEDEALAEDDER